MAIPPLTRWLPQGKVRSAETSNTAVLTSSQQSRKEREGASRALGGPPPTAQQPSAACHLQGERPSLPAAAGTLSGCEEATQHFSRKTPAQQAGLPSRSGAKLLQGAPNPAAAGHRAHPGLSLTHTHTREHTHCAPPMRKSRVTKVQQRDRALPHTQSLIPSRKPPAEKETPLDKAPHHKMEWVEAVLLVSNRRKSSERLRPEAQGCSREKGRR